VFEIKDSVDFYGKMIEDYDDLVENPGSSRHAINCALSAYHIAEWIWGDWLKTDYDAWKKLKIRDREGFLRWASSSNSWYVAIADVANGSKHFALGLAETKATGAYAAAGYMRPGYQETHLEIQANGQWVDAATMFEDVVMFWDDFFRTYRPSVTLPSPRNPFTRTDSATP
jgi:hypothetical protein